MCAAVCANIFQKSNLKMAWAKRDIIDYYHRNWLGYGLWGKNMHYGYWEKHTRTIRQATENFNRVLAQKAAIIESDHVLDAGCGVGAAAIYLSKRTGCKVTGITITPKHVKKAYRNAEKAGVSHLTEFREMDYCKTDFPDSTFTVVWGLESICYAECTGTFIREAYRILKPGGRLIVADGFASKNEYFGKEKRQMRRWLDGWLLNKLDTPYDFKNFASKAGFRFSDYRNVTENVFLTSKIMFVASWPFFMFHLYDRFFPTKSYPSDAPFHQYIALKNRLWEYGIFYAEK